MFNIAIKEALGGRIALDSNVTVKGWVRTRRDSQWGCSSLDANAGP